MKALLLIMLVACAKPAGGPLSHTFDNTKIASVPLEQKQSVTEAQQQHEMAVLARTNANGSYRDAEIEEDLADYQADKAVVVSQVVAARQPNAKLAPASAETAGLARKTAEAKFDFIKARRGWLAKLTDSSLYAVYATQAKLELERARVAQANHLTAADFTLDAFQKQADGRDQAAKAAAAAAESERKTAETKLAAWAELEKAYLQASGVMGPFESSRFAKEWMNKDASVASPPPAAPPVETPAAPPASTTAPTEPIAPMQKP